MAQRGRPRKNAVRPEAAIAPAEESVQPRPVHPQLPAKLRVRLLRHYRPNGRLSEQNIHERADAPLPGLDQPQKLWAGSIVSLPFEEARRLIENKVTVREWSKDALGNKVHTDITRSMPLAERADDYTLEQ